VQTVFFWTVAVAYSLLMRYEFFLGNFLKKRLLLYSFSHMLIMPLIITWISSAYVPLFTFTVPILQLCLLSLLGGFSFELARKIHAPTAERQLVDSYSKSIGLNSSVASTCLCLLAGILTQYYLLKLLQTHQWPYYLLGLLYAVTVSLYIIGLIKKNEKQFRLSEVFVSLFMLISYLSIIIEIQLK
jgi:4-hydroxybenzoate polyprenyltransferase